MELVRVEVDRVIGSMTNDYAVVVKSDDKSFLIYVGQPEVFAILRELRGEASIRPMAHDVTTNVFVAFDIEIRQIVISSIVDNIFCATLLLKQDLPSETGEVRRNEVRLDLRASDAMIIALKTGSPLWATREVIDQVRDVTRELAEAESEAEAGDSDGDGDPEPDPEF